MANVTSGIAAVRGYFDGTKTAPVTFYRQEGSQLVAAPAPTMTDFRDQWGALPESCKTQLRTGMTDGTLTY